MEFLTDITTTVPAGTPGEEVERRRSAEAVRARELTAAGNLLRLWRPAGELRSVGLWRAADAAEMERVLASLPLRPWMTITVTDLEAHPNDPGA
jgi:muconolactone delta-isomerase